ncbi:tyrosine-type recombinase/integrase [Enterocloster bolteae]|uniref:tyrosine-type recombinase/integrase n=1 Tax=Enterocloster bolteae TaxID=208479 RepID=UPI00210B5DE3|nr:tyrosine-type recombinase/integrase [Enterocloster bolteae]MCQ5144690.1 tyrosine-type recombinase/integrase [Enterocloster bolteae]
MNIYGEFQEKLCLFRNYLLEEERSAATIEKYGRDVLAFLSWLSDREEISKEVVVGYKQAIIGKYKTTSANSMLVSVNRFLDFIGKNDCQVKLFKIQRNPFRKKDKELTKEEYNRLILAAKAKSSSRLFLMIQAICSTGIRVSEHRFITREALERGRITIYNKGKERVVFLPKKLKKCLLQYCRQNGIYSGPVFVTKNGTPVNRCNVWAEMKALCKEAGVSPEKVFPHNLRHLFAVTYYRMQKDIVHLADILGHSNIEYTRIYTFTSEEEHARVLSRMCLLI